MAPISTSAVTRPTSPSSDQLTGLATRDELLDQAAGTLKRCAPTGTLTGMAVLDVEDMTGINELLGSAGGNEVLQRVAERLSFASRPQDTVARIGGDEFAVLMDAVTSDDDVRVHVAGLVRAASGCIRIGGRTVRVNLHTGLATSSCTDPDVLLADAERAATNTRRGQAAGTAGCVDQRGADELRRAIRATQLRLHYHPVIDLTSNQLVGVEALVRWQHPERGLLPPSEFIGLAEASGLIEDLGEWVLRTAAAQAARWNTEGRPLDVAINLSPCQMSRPGFADRVAAVLRGVGAPAERIILEVTESALMDQKHAAETLEALRRSGIRLALDDFGTGYASLSYLRRFPVDAIKIDRSFVSGLGHHPQDDAIVASIVSLARNIGKTVVAEGVETLEQVDLLRSLGVQRAQGFLWTQPLPADELDAWAYVFEELAQLPKRRHRAIPVPPSGPPPKPGSAEEQILVMHADGASMHTIAAALNNECRRRTSGLRWHMRSVAQFIASVPTSDPHA